MSLTVVIKEIKPQRLKVDAIRLEILNALRAEGKYHQSELKKTVRTWRGKPQFESLIGLTGKDMTVVTGPTGDTEAVQHWVWADQGTKGHWIDAKHAPYLVFQRGNIPKTAPGQFSARVGGKVGRWVRKKRVWHKGGRPRQWSEILSKRRRGPFTKAMIGAIQRGADKVY